jgi:hypothetical protein
VYYQYNSLSLSVSLSLCLPLSISLELSLYISFVVPPYLVRIMHMLVRTQLSHVRITCWLRVLTRTPFHCATSLACNTVAKYSHPEWGSGYLVTSWFLSFFSFSYIHQPSSKYVRAEHFRERKRERERERDRERAKERGICQSSVKVHLLVNCAVIVTLLLYFYSNGTARRARVVVAHRFPYLFDR